MSSADTITLESLPELLKNDDKVKLAGVDVDGVLRGKLMQKKKFLSIAESGFGFCSVIFGWDMHDATYFKELGVSNKENGYRDMIAIPDLSSFRRIPWENDVPFFLVSFFEPDTMLPVCACPRGLLKRMLGRLERKGYNAMAGGIPCIYHVPGIFIIRESHAPSVLTSRFSFFQPSTNFTSSRPPPPSRLPPIFATMPRTPCPR